MALSASAAAAQEESSLSNRNDDDDDDDDRRPLVFSSGYSTRSDLVQALQEAVEMAVQGLPPNNNNNNNDEDVDDDNSSSSNGSSSFKQKRKKQMIDLCLVSVSSLYDGGTVQPSAVVVPTILTTAKSVYGAPIQHLIGSCVAGCISSSSSSSSSSSTSTSSSSTTTTTTRTIELEGIPAVSVTLALLPGVDEIRTFDVGASDIPDDIDSLSREEWTRPLGLSGFGGDTSAASDESKDDASPVFILIPSPAFAVALDELLHGISHYYPNAQTIGGISSTVSSLSRARLYRYSATTGQPPICITTAGCIGLAMRGDVQVQTLVANGAKPVGGIYKILQGKDSTIQAIVLDEAATEALKLEEEQDEQGKVQEDEEDDEEEDDDEKKNTASAQAAALNREKMLMAYAKARIPKPILAEANFLMKTLSDDDQAFMRRQLLVGLEQGGGSSSSSSSAIGSLRSASSITSSSELARLAQGQGHRFRVHPVASAGMKDGSVTFALGSVDVMAGTRMRFFVRESGFAKKEVEALWLGYKKRLLNEQFIGTSTTRNSKDSSSSSNNNKQDASTSTTFKPAGCIVIPTLDRGSKFFLGKPGFESSAAARLLPGVPCIAGFFSNGVIGRMEQEGPGARQVEVQGSASGYFLIGSKSGRPIFSAAAEAAKMAARKQEQAVEEEAARMATADDEKRRLRATKGPQQDLATKAPRSDNGELILKRREVHSGRALTVSTVEWSVAEKTATPSSTLEGFMWDKETEVDRFRERQPLSNLVSQCRLASTDPTAPKPRDFIGPIKQQAANNGFVVIPECKRMELSSGSLRRRYDISQLARDFTLAGAPAISINCDGVLFGGSMEDISTARKASSAASVEQMSEDGVIVPPLLASDLLLYPYQLYKLSLAGADAVNLIVGALAAKDLVYLTKIAASLKLQKLATVTSAVQLEALAALPKGSIDAVIISNRELEDFSFDETGNQAIKLLTSDALQKVKQTHGDGLPVLVEGRVGLIEWPNQDGVKSTEAYLEELKKEGAIGAIVGSGLVVDGMESSDVLVAMQKGRAKAK
jgi:indole-3-glycerol phosphate synthase